MEEIEILTSQDGREFVIHSGISDSLIEQLVIASGQDDEDLKKFTGDPRRFSDIEKVRLWLQEEGRRVYTLTPAEDRDILAGFGWLRVDHEIHIPDSAEDEILLQEYRATQGIGTHTVAARLYGDFRGKRLATPFMVSAHRDYIAFVGGNIAGILADIHRENTPSQKLFTRLGYQLLGPQGERTLWVLDKTQAKRYI